ncbi:Uncharacterised protein [Vibrio cholerae]|nr:Uncharacterised protein [Vibrio cholerae]CSI80418.1 Uncharacterised protein [Vibrio cholerae]CSI96476.1 Uncharacterised protein [Vibrio cholerae]
MLIARRDHAYVVRCWWSLSLPLPRFAPSKYHRWRYERRHLNLGFARSSG